MKYQEILTFHENLIPEVFGNEVYPKREPVLMKNLDIGPCNKLWTPDYLCEHTQNPNVKIHVCEKSQMDFLNKNFLYRTLPFNELVKRASRSINKEYFISETEKYYLRALGEDPRQDVADVSKDFPLLSQDLLIPQFFEEQQFFSSVFRIGSAGVQLWTHYDVMDNILIQVRGRKRVILFHPEDVALLYMKEDKSQILDIDNPDLERYPNFHKARRYECILEEGDVLFIPALWLHNVISLEFGVAVNVFWRHLDLKMYVSKDIYGNHDPLPYQQAEKFIDKSLEQIQKLPISYRKFYAEKLCQRIQDCIISGDLGKEKSSPAKIIPAMSLRESLLHCIFTAPSPIIRTETIARKCSTTNEEIDKTLNSVPELGFKQNEYNGTNFVIKPSPSELQSLPDGGQGVLSEIGVSFKQYVKKYGALKDVSARDKEILESLSLS